MRSLPFGGVGHSGMGGYHGKNTFDTFTHFKPVYSTSTGLEAINKYAIACFVVWNSSLLYIIMAVWLTVVHIVLLTLFVVVCRVRYPPFTATKLSRMKWLMTPSARRGRSGSLFMLVLFVAAVAVLYKVTLLSTTMTLSIILQIVILCRFLVFHRGFTNLATKT